MSLEIAVVSTIFAVGNILLGRFEEGTPRWRRLAKFVLVMLVSLAISRAFGRPAFWAFVGCMALPALYIHLWWLPSKGVNGWTAEPREKYYELRGWKLPRS